MQYKIFSLPFSGDVDRAPFSIATVRENPL